MGSNEAVWSRVLPEQTGIRFQPPKLVLFVVVDQFRYDYLLRFAGAYTGGIARLLERGAVLGVVRVGPGFGADIDRGRAGQVQVLMDGTNSNDAGIVSAYVNRLVTMLGRRRNPQARWRLTAADLAAFYRRFYAPNNAVLIVAGDTTAAAVRSAASMSVGDTSEPSARKYKLPSRPSSRKPVGNFCTMSPV